MVIKIKKTSGFRYSLDYWDLYGLTLIGFDYMALASR